MILESCEIIDIVLEAALTALQPAGDLTRNLPKKHIYTKLQTILTILIPLSSSRILNWVVEEKRVTFKCKLYEIILMFVLTIYPQFFNLFFLCVKNRDPSGTLKQSGECYVQQCSTYNDFTAKTSLKLCTVGMTGGWAWGRGKPISQDPNLTLSL